MNFKHVKKAQITYRVVDLGAQIFLFAFPVTVVRVKTFSYRRRDP